MTVPDYFDEFPNCDMVWNEKLGFVQNWQLLLTREPLDDARDLNNIIFENLVACYKFQRMLLRYVMSLNVGTPLYRS